MAEKTIVWYRKDLRVTDNHALMAARLSGQAVVALYILEHDDIAGWEIGGASKWWLHASITKLETRLAALNIPLLLFRGEPESIIAELAETLQASEIHWNRRYEPAIVARDTALKESLRQKGMRVHSHPGNVLFEPWQIVSQTGTPYRVFTPFWKACMARMTEQGRTPAPVLATPEAQAEMPDVSAVTGERLEDWRLLPTAPDWAGGLRASWQPGEAGAQQRLEDFIAHGLCGYKEGRNEPAKPHVSRLSPHLHWGEISVRQVWHRVIAEQAMTAVPERDVTHFFSELGWREFSTHLLWYQPDLPEIPLQKRFADFPWKQDDAAFVKWCKGMTGIPLVDAGMRELWQTGWMHNRVRMVVASFLVKNLLLPWQMGEKWFWDTLVDADLANNSASWQWVAGCGADAAPYFRVFNPVLQGEKFDPNGEYVRRYIPEIAGLPDKFIHQPWQASQMELRLAGIRLGETYPTPMIGLAQSRQDALEAYARIKQSEGAPG